MDELDQLELFRQQLSGNAKRANEKKKRTKGQDACIRVTAGTHIKAQVLSIWLDVNRPGHPHTLMAIMEEALDLLIEERYPKAKRLIPR